MQMTAEPAVDDQAARCGLTLYGPNAIPANDVRELLQSLAEAFDAQVIDGGESALPTIVFPITGSSLRALPATPADAPQQVSALFEEPLAWGVRLEARYAGDAAPDCEVAMLYAASELGRGVGCLAYDDGGFVYDPEELDVLGQRGAARAEFFACHLASAKSAAARIAILDTPAMDVSRCEAPPDARADLVFPQTAVFVLSNRFLPVVDLARIVLAASGDARSNNGPREVAVLAPHLDESARALLATLGVKTYASESALRSHVAGAAAEATESARPLGRRDELALLTPLVLERGRARTILERFARRLQTMAALAADLTIPAQIEIVEDDDVFEPGLPSRIGAFVYPQARIDVYHQQLDHAHPSLRAALAQRLESGALFGRPAQNAVIVELRESAADLDGSVSSDFVRADALSVALAQLYSAAANALAVDVTGAVYGADELIRLGMVSHGRALSWSRRVAVAGYDAAS